jgi:hypothetical protein
MSTPLKPPGRIFSPKAIVGTIGFYVAVTILFFWADHVSPSGPCTPGAGILMFLFLPFVSAILLFITLTFVARGRKSQIIPAIVHGLVLLGFICLYFYSRG